MEVRNWMMKREHEKNQLQTVSCTSLQSPWLHALTVPPVYPSQNIQELQSMEEEESQEDIATYVSS